MSSNWGVNRHSYVEDPQKHQRFIAEHLEQTLLPPHLSDVRKRIFKNGLFSAENHGWKWVNDVMRNGISEPGRIRKSFKRRIGHVIQGGHPGKVVREVQQVHDPRQRSIKQMIAEDPRLENVDRFFENPFTFDFDDAKALTATDEVLKDEKYPGNMKGINFGYSGVPTVFMAYCYHELREEGMNEEFLEAYKQAALRMDLSRRYANSTRSGHTDEERNLDEDMRIDLFKKPVANLMLWMEYQMGPLFKNVGGKHFDFEIEGLREMTEEYALRVKHGVGLGEGRWTEAFDKEWKALQAKRMQPGAMDSFESAREYFPNLTRADYEREKRRYRVHELIHHGAFTTPRTNPYEGLRCYPQMDQRAVHQRIVYAADLLLQSPLFPVEVRKKVFSDGVINKWVGDLMRQGISEPHDIRRNLALRADNVEKGAKPKDVVTKGNVMPTVRRKPLAEVLGTDPDWKDLEYVLRKEGLFSFDFSDAEYLRQLLQKSQGLLPPGYSPELIIFLAYCDQELMSDNAHKDIPGEHAFDYLTMRRKLNAYMLDPNDANAKAGICDALEERVRLLKNDPNHHVKRMEKLMLALFEIVMGRPLDFGGGAMIDPENEQDFFKKKYAQLIQSLRS